VALALAAGAGSLAAAASAQDASATLAPVVVTATRSERLQLDVPASVDLIDGDTVRDAQLRINLSESLTRVPGIVVLNRQNYAQDLQISIRGFGSRAAFGVRGVRLYVDGVPANSPDGQGQVSHFPLNLADRIEVLRGPFSALYGNASGGVIALTTQLKPQEPRFELSGAAGSDGTWRGGFTGRGGSDGYAFTLDATRFKTDGPREHSAAQRDTLNLRVGLLDSPIGKVRLSLNSLAMPDSQDPLGMSRSDLALRGWSGVTQTALDFDTRKTSRQTTLGANVETPIGDRLTLTTSAWVGTRAVMQYQAIPTGAQTAASSPGGVIDFDRTLGGIDLRATYQQGPVSASLGVDLQRLDEDRRGYQNFTGPAAAPTARGALGPLRRDENNLVQSVDPYLQAEWRFTPQWLLHAGVRGARVKFDSRDRFLSNGDDSGAVSFNGTNPSAGIVFRAAPAVSLYTSYARGFETPTLNELAYRPDGSAGLNTALKPSKSDNVEAGLKVARPRASYSLALFRVTTSDEIVVLRNTGGRSSFGNATKTRRDGLEASLNWRPTERLALFASAGVIDARYTQSFQACRTTQCSLLPTVPPQPNAPETIAADNKLPGIPARTLLLEASYKAGFADLTIHWRGQSALWVNDTNTDRASGYGVLGLSIARTLDVLGRQPRVFARVDNALDKRYFGSVIVNEGNSRFFEPAPGRTWLVGLDWPL
jgi:iron complex outermembrane receptor protein